MIKKRKTIGVVIPSYYPKEAIHNVLRTVFTGIQKFLPNSDFYVVVVDSSDKETQQNISKTVNELGKNIILHFGNRRITKGKAIFIGLNILKEKKPDAVLLIDADLKSIRPDWIDEFFKPILNNNFDFIAPLYVRHKHDSLLTNHIIYPFVNSCLGANLRQPIGGDFSISKKLFNFILKKPHFSKEVSQFGIDIWLSINAICNKFKLGQIFLGTKDHGNTIKNFKFPEKSLGNMFVEVIKTLFDQLVVYKHIWQKQNNFKVKTFGKIIKIDPMSVPANSNNLWLTFKRLYPKYQFLIEKNLNKKNIDQIKMSLMFDKPNDKFTDKFWADILFSYLLKYQRINNESQKRELIESILPIYFARMAYFVVEAKNWDTEETEKKIQLFSKNFSDKKHLLISNF